MVKEMLEGASVAIESDLTDPLVESRILEHGVEPLLRDHTILARYVVHVDEQVESLRPASKQWPKIDVALEMAPKARSGRRDLVPAPADEQGVEEPVVMPALDGGERDVMDEGLD